MEFGGRYRTGKLMAKRIIRIKANKDRNPFARRIIKSNQSYAFAVASDISGSMNNTRKEESNMSYAMTSLFMVGEALRIAGIKRSMIIFGRKAVEINNMDKKQLRWEEITNEKKIRKANDSFTDIGEAIDKCREKLENTKAERKIMIVLTDGSSGQIKMERMHKMAVKKGIECIGITIGNYANAMDVVFGKKNKTIEDTRDGKQIGKTFIEILKESIKKSI
jgi:nitric oxide reductase activation protein